MESGEILRFGFGTFLAFAVLGALFFLKRWLRKRLLPDKGTGSTGESLAELFSLQARLEAKVESGERLEGGEDGD
jgi:hypothetical protein